MNTLTLLGRSDFDQYQRIGNTVLAPIFRGVVVEFTPDSRGATINIRDSSGGSETTVRDSLLSGPGWTTAAEEILIYRGRQRFVVQPDTENRDWLQ